MLPLIAEAQTTKPKPKPKPSGPRFEVNFHGGFASGSGTPDGLSETPPVLQTFTMADGVTPTRAVSSWYFGDGASLLNQVLQARGTSARLDLLDVPHWPAASRRAGPQFGVTLGHHVKGGVWLEWSVDVGMDPLGFDDDARSRVENSRADFETAFKALAASAASIITSSTVTSTADFNPDGRRLMVSGVIHYRGDGPVMRPYLLAGLGAASSFGNPGTVTLKGTYRFTTPGQTTIEETDTMRLSYEASGSAIWIFGGGMMRDLSRSSAYRVEIRLLASSTNLTGHLDTEPSQVTASPGGAIILNATSPGLQFSSSTAIRSNLSEHQNGFQAFTGDARAFQWVLSAGYVRRF